MRRINKTHHQTQRQRLIETRDLNIEYMIAISASNLNHMMLLDVCLAFLS